MIPQKQEGLYAVEYHPLGGCPAPSKFAELYALIAPMEDVEIRLAPDETMYIIHLTGEEAKKFLRQRRTAPNPCWRRRWRASARPSAR